MVKALEAEMIRLPQPIQRNLCHHDGDQIAALYCVPTITMRGTGRYIVFSPAKRLAVLPRGGRYLPRRGCPKWDHADLEVVPIGSAVPSRTVTWKIVGLMEAWQGSLGIPTTSFASPRAGAF